MLPPPRPIDEVHGLDPAQLHEQLPGWTTPKVIRGLVSHWPLVAAARTSDAAAVAHLAGFDPGRMPVTATTAAPEAQGRLFYNEDMSGFNFRREQVPLKVVLATLLKYARDPSPPSIYVASTTLDSFLPGLAEANPLHLGMADPLTSIWIGNRSRIAAHQDVPDNLACVAAGRRRVTLFAPDQVRNLYVGPLDLTPAGQAISLVDFHAPDLERFPRFREALAQAQAAELAPGDAVFIPSLWWHHMEGLDAFNVLINSWWRPVPAWMDSPMNALMLAILAVRDLPEPQRAQWRAMFDHYVFDADTSTSAHIPAHARGVLAPLHADGAAQIRQILRQRLQR
ncbi:transcription factor jumonji/aspartyl beta-hydroxylase [Stenotrophomonas sp. SKA14]|uniref:cupin-like domain-containing protein n=1 Tax=Stenotrophomonas TaxID=40323 RepID=UPI00018FE7BF|nr:cupin-like domain-containing protein [Stenotrophomonas sp. SKA14]EED38285.1 transcription factor jumonji/aspartyl beta-hydroxylase [Stenotrophomonas sp. SKA14]